MCPVRFVTHVSGRSFAVPCPPGTPNIVSAPSARTSIPASSPFSSIVTSPSAGIMRTCSIKLRTISKASRPWSGSRRAASRVLDVGAVDCRQIGMQERLVFGCLSRRARQSLLLGFQLFELGNGLQGTEAGHSAFAAGGSSPTVPDAHIAFSYNFRVGRCVSQRFRASSERRMTTRRKTQVQLPAFDEIEKAHPRILDKFLQVAR